MLGRRSLLLALVVGLLVLTAPGQGRCQTDPGAETYVAGVAQSALEVMTAKSLNDSERMTRFRQIFLGATDMPEIGRFVLGRHWRTASPAQQAEFLKLFEDVVVLTWSTRFKDYAATVNHKVTGSDPDGERGVIVRSVVDREAQPPVNLAWRVRQKDGGYKVIDLMVEGTSMAITYRSEYASVMQANGGRIEGLLAALQNKILQLSQASPR